MSKHSALIKNNYQYFLKLFNIERDDMRLGGRNIRLICIRQQRHLRLSPQKYFPNFAGQAHVAPSEKSGTAKLPPALAASCGLMTGIGTS